MAPPIVSVSVGITPNTMLSINRDDSSANGSPTMIPITTMRSAWPSTMRCTRDGRAPSARRTPISRVRVVTMYDINP